MAKPEIRLKGFEGEWNSDIIGNLATFSKGRGYSKSDLRKQGNPIILYGRLYTNYSSIIDYVDTFASLHKGAVLSKGNEVIIPGSGETPEDIAIASSVEQEGVILGGDLNILSFDFEKVVPAFAAIGITYSKTHYELSDYAQGKTVVHLHNSSISKGHLSYPSREEQEAIVIYMSTIDSLILSSTKKIESLKQMKQACLVSMFPQAGETTPRVRFKGFEGKWTTECAGHLFNTFNERNRPDLPVLSANQDIRGMAPRNDIGYQISHNRSNEVTYKVVRPGQFVIHLRSFQGGFAHSSVLGITSPAYTVFGFKNSQEHDDYFWKIIFMSKEFIKNLETITYGIRDGKSISFTEFSQMKFLYPSKDEQQRIASYFRSLDKQISLQEKRLEKLKQIKAACLDKMFV